MRSPYPDDEAPPLPPPPPSEPDATPPFEVSRHDAVVAMIVEDTRGGTKPNRPAAVPPPPAVHPSVAAAPCAAATETANIFLITPRLGPNLGHRPAPAPGGIRVRAASEVLGKLDKPPLKLVLLVLAFVLTNSCVAAGPVVVERSAVWSQEGYYNVDLTLKGLYVQLAAQLLQADADAHAERLQCAAPRTEIAAAKETTRPGKTKEGEPPAPPDHTTLISGRLYCGAS